MNYYLQDICSLCLSISDVNVHLEYFTSKCSDDLTHLNKIEASLVELSNVLATDSKICYKCSITINFIYDFNKSCLNNVKILSSYKERLKENMVKKHCGLCVKLNKYEHLNQSETKLANFNINPENSLLRNNLENKIEFVAVNDSVAVKIKQEVADNTVSNDICETISLNNEIKEPLEEIEIKYELLDVGEKSIDSNTEGVKSIVEYSYLNVVHTEDKQSAETIEEQINEENSRVSQDFNETKTKIIYKKYPCDICKKMYSTKTLSRHKRTHIGIKPYKCDICGKPFSQKGNMLKHVNTHTGVKPYKCDICNKEFNDKSNCDKHKQRHSGDNTVSNDVCETISLDNEIKEPLEEIEIKQELFDVGEKSIDSNTEGVKSIVESSYLNVVHTEDKQSVESIEEQIYEENSRASQDFSETKTKIIYKKYPCDICKKMYSTKTLRRHTRTHIGVKPYKCDICGKPFSQKGNMLIHMNIHTGVKPYKCDVCGKSFSQKGNMLKHMITHTSDSHF